MYPKAKVDIDRGHHAAGVRRMRMLILPLGKVFEGRNARSKVRKSEPSPKTCTAVLTATGLDILIYGSSAVARTPSYC